MKHRCLHALLLVLWLWSCSGWAAEAGKQEQWSVNYLPLTEAEQLVRSALSSTGAVVALPSRHLLVVNDDASHLSQAKQLLEQFDRMQDQYRVTVTLMESKQLSEQGLQASVALPGGWLQLQDWQGSSHYRNNQQWSLSLLSGKEGRFSVGEVQPYRQRIKQWLAGYGLIERDSVNLVALTSGFFVRMRSVGKQQVEVHLAPWLARSQPGVPSSATPELLIGLGTAASPNQAATAADLPLRLNATPQFVAPQPIRIVRAATKLMLAVGETVVIAASGGESTMLSRTLLARHSSVGKRTLVLQLKVDRVP